MVSKKVTSFMKRVMFGFEYGHIAQSGLASDWNYTGILIQDH